MAIGPSFVLTGTAPHTQLSTGGGNTLQTLTLDVDCRAVMLSGLGSGTNLAYVTFDNSSASASNGIVIMPQAQPVIIPLGYYSHSAHTLKMIGSAATTVLNVLQMK